MLDDFFIRALLAGIGVALVAGPLGCFIVWRRMAYFGDTIAHASLLGVVFAFVLEINLIIGVFAVAALITLSLVLLGRSKTLPTDALLGILAHSTLALGLVTISLLAWLRVDLAAYLFGDILSVSHGDLAIIYLAGAAILATLILIWRPLLAGTVSHDMAEAEGLHPERARIIFTLLMAAVVAAAMKVVGILLITSLLIIPAATARRFAPTPEWMAVIAAAIGASAVVGGLYGSLAYNTPSGPSIVVTALVLFLISLMPLQRLAGQRRIRDRERQP